MENLRDFVLHPHIHSALERWLEGIRKVQARRKEEIVNATNRHRNVGNRHQEDKGTSGLLSRSVFIHLVAGDPMIVSPLDTIYIFDKDTWMRLPNKRAGILLVFFGLLCLNMTKRVTDIDLDVLSQSLLWHSSWFPVCFQGVILYLSIATYLYMPIH